MRWINRKTLWALVAAATLVVAGCGDDATSGASKATGNGIDRAFVADMVPHHKSAVAMATIAQQRGKSAFVKQLADDIVTSQTKEIAIMRREGAALDGAGIKRGSLGVPMHMMGMDGDVASLRTADPFDRAFIKMMLPHHEGAVAMAKVELAKGADPKLKALAQDITDAQQREIAAMRKHFGGSGSMDSMGAMDSGGRSG